MGELRSEEMVRQGMHASLLIGSTFGKGPCKNMAIGWRVQAKSMTSARLCSSILDGIGAVGC